MIRILDAKYRPTPVGGLVMLAVAAILLRFHAWAILPAYIIRYNIESCWAQGIVYLKYLPHPFWPFSRTFDPGEILRADDGVLVLMTAFGAASLIGMVCFLRRHPVRRVRSLGRYRPTLLGGMVMVAVVAILLKFYTWAILPAFVVRRRLRLYLNDVISDETEDPFWPHYWRQLRGMPAYSELELNPRSDDGGLILMTAIGLAVLLGSIFAFRKRLVRRL